MAPGDSPATEPGFPGEGQDPEQTIQGLLPIEEASPLDDADTDEVQGADGAAGADPTKKRRRRRRRRSGAPREGVAAGEPGVVAEQGTDTPG